MKATLALTVVTLATLATGARADGPWKTALKNYAATRQLTGPNGGHFTGGPNGGGAFHANGAVLGAGANGGAVAGVEGQAVVAQGPEGNKFGAAPGVLVYNNKVLWCPPGPTCVAYDDEGNVAYLPNPNP